MALSAGSAVKGATTSRLLNRLAYNFANKATDVGTAATGDRLIGVDVSADYEIKYFDAADIAVIMGTTQADQTKLAAITATAVEVNYNDITTLGTGAASKAVVLDTGDNYTWPATGILTYGVLKDPAGTTLGATVAEVNAAADVSVRLVSIADAATYAVLVANSGKPHVLPDLSQGITITLPTPASGLEYEFYYKGVAADAANWVINSASNTNYFVGGLAHLDSDAGAAGTEVVAIAGDGNSNSKLTVVTPGVGTRVKAICDGTLWILSGFVVSATVPSFADQ